MARGGCRAAACCRRLAGRWRGAGGGRRRGGGLYRVAPKCGSLSPRLSASRHRSEGPFSNCMARRRMIPLTFWLTRKRARSRRRRIGRADAHHRWTTYRTQHTMSTPYAERHAAGTRSAPAPNALHSTKTLHGRSGSRGSRPARPTIRSPALLLPLPYSSARGRAARRTRLRVAASASTTSSTAKQRIVRCTPICWINTPVSAAPTASQP